MAKASHGLTPDLTVLLKLVALGVQFRRASTRKTKPRGTAIIFMRVASSVPP